MAFSSDGREETLPARASWPLVRDWRWAFHLLLALVGILGSGLLVYRARQDAEPAWLLAALGSAAVAALALMEEHVAEALERARKGVGISGATNVIRWKPAVAAVALAAVVTRQAPWSRWPADVLVLLWAGSLLAYVWALASPPNVRANHRGWSRSAMGALALVALLALWWRWMGLAQAPRPVTGPETRSLLEAARLLSGEGASPFDEMSFGTTGLLVYLQSSGMRILGDGLLGARAVSALAGVGAVLFLCGLADELYGRTVALAAALVLASMALHVHYSRLAVEHGPALFFGVAALWALVRATRTAAPRWWGGVGVLLGVGVMISPLAWLVVGVAIWWVVLTAWLEPGEWRGQWSRLIWGIGGAGLAVAPGLAVGGLVWPGAFVPGVTALGEWTRGSADGLVVVVRQARDAFLGWLAYGDHSRLYGVSGPLLDVVSRVLMLAGLGALAARGIERRALWLGGWLVLVALADGLTLSAPSSHVLLFGAPAVALLVAVGSQAVWQALFHGQPPAERALRVTAFTALSVTLVVLLNVTFYFNSYLPHTAFVPSDTSLVALLTVPLLPWR